MADYGYRGPPRPHPTGYVYPAEVPQRSTSVSSLNVPFLLVIAGAIALVSITGGITYSATIQFTEIRTAIERLTDKFIARSDSQDARIDRVERAMSEKTLDRYTRTEHELWCSRTEQANAAIGWKCANLEGRLNFAPRLHGWDNK